jgi:hypothetical protein
MGIKTAAEYGMGISVKAKLRGAVVLLWIAAMFLLIRYEAYPELFTHTLSGYRGVLPETVLIKDAWSRVIINGIAAGYSHISMNVDDSSESENIEISSRLYVKVAVRGRPMSISARSALLLDPAYELINFRSSVSGAPVELRISGKRTQGQMYEVHLNMGGLQTVRQIEIPKDVLLFSPMSAAVLRRLRPGQSISIKSIDPFSMKPSNIIIKAGRKEKIEHNGEMLEATPLVSAYQGVRLHSWIDAHGNIIRQETPLGWVIESCSAEDALDAVTKLKKPPELGGSAALLKVISGRKL